MELAKIIEKIKFEEIIRKIISQINPSATNFVAQRYFGNNDLHLFPIFSSFKLIDQKIINQELIYLGSTKDFKEAYFYSKTWCPNKKENAKCSLFTITYCFDSIKFKNNKLYINGPLYSDDEGCNFKSTYNFISNDYNNVIEIINQ